MQTARDLMNSNVITISPETTVGRAIDILVELGVSGLPVVDSEKHILGVITEFALLAIVYDPSVVTDPVGQHMTKQVISVRIDDHVRTVADLFILHRIRRVLVEKDGKLAGLISRRDLLKAGRTFCKSLTAASPFAEQAAAKATQIPTCVNPCSVGEVTIARTLESC
jgi:CBS domain-containing protein